MSYLVLARKYRPQRFSELVGQEHVARTLSNAIAQNRVHHAFLFTGARGVGKTSAARILAKALSCEKGPTAEPCGTCDLCQEIAGGRSVDVIEIDAASNTKVEETKSILEGVRYLPARARRKVYIIDEVHMLSAHSFNALLKTLEEPPPHVVFVFATTEVHKIPVTILSRC
jgi:DNA polymerase III subunit gamma/tau